MPRDKCGCVYCKSQDAADPSQPRGSLVTRHWREMDSNPRSPVGRDRTSGANVGSSGRKVAPQDRSGRVRLPLTWPGPRQTIDFGSFLLRHLCLEIGGRTGTRGTLLMTFVGSFHHSKIMLRVLVKVLSVNAIAICRRPPAQGRRNVQRFD